MTVLHGGQTPDHQDDADGAADEVGNDQGLGKQNHAHGDAAATIKRFPAPVEPVAHRQLDELGGEDDDQRPADEFGDQDRSALGIEGQHQTTQQDPQVLAGVQAELFYLFKVHSILLYSTLPPLTVRRNLAPSISAALRHIIMRPRKMSKYSYMVQMSSSICRFREILPSSALTFRL